MSGSRSSVVLPLFSLATGVVHLAGCCILASPLAIEELDLFFTDLVCDGDIVGEIVIISLRREVVVFSGESVKSIFSGKVDLINVDFVVVSGAFVVFINCVFAAFLTGSTVVVDVGGCVLVLVVCGNSSNTKSSSLKLFAVVVGVAARFSHASSFLRNNVVGLTRRTPPANEFVEAGVVVIAAEVVLMPNVTIDVAGVIAIGTIGAGEVLTFWP